MSHESPLPKMARSRHPGIVNGDPLRRGFESNRIRTAARVRAAASLRKRGVSRLSRPGSFAHRKSSGIPPAWAATGHRLPVPVGLLQVSRRWWLRLRDFAISPGRRICSAASGRFPNSREMRYWSTTHKRWQTLIVDAYALSGPGPAAIDAAETSRKTRSRKTRFYTFIRRITCPAKRFTACVFEALPLIGWYSIPKTSAPYGTG